jgi:hypothetical protein
MEIYALLAKNNGTYVVKCRVCECGSSETSSAIWNPNDETFAVAGYRLIQVFFFKYLFVNNSIISS